ncbi:MAG TPA: DUF4375 domain-containing protein [Longimicrobium sp.]
MKSDLRVPAAGLAGADDAELAWRVIEPAYDAVSIYDGPEALASQLRPLTGGQRALLALHWCVSETMNGGFDQFFTNPSGLLADEARAAFERIGVPEAASLLDQARALLASRPAEADPDDPAYDEAEDADRFDAYQAQYEPLEERFYELVDAEIYPRAAAYVRAHPDEFTR